MAHYTLRFSHEFVEHLSATIAYLAEQNPAAANTFRQATKVSLQRLKTYPRLGRAVQSPIDRLRRYRRIVLPYDYLLFYYLDSQARTIDIVDIVHGRQSYWHLL